MLYSGIIKNSKGQPLSAQYAVINSYHPGEIQGPVYDTGTSGAYAIDLANEYEFLNVYAPGYVSTVYSVSDITKTNGSILLPTESLIKPWMIVAVIAAVLVYRKQSGKIGKLGKEDLLPIFLITGGVIAFVLIKQLLEKLGIWDSAETKALKLLSSDPNSFWSPTFWQRINPNGNAYNNALTEDQARDYITQIKNAFGILNDDPESVKSVFRSLSTKANASFIAWEFQKTDNADLLAYLRNGGGILPWDGLKDADIMEITNYVNALPNY